MRVLDLFSGVGGMSLGLKRAGMRTVAFCEVEPFCRAVLAKHWPATPIHADVRTLRGVDVGAVDLVCGGVPCQDVSVAGKRAGLGTDESPTRTGLWREMFRLVRELRPRWVLVENVPGLRTLGADRVLEDLEAAGYSCWPLVVGACDVGAPHRRKRVWIVAHSRERGRLAGIPGAHAGQPDAAGLCALADSDIRGRGTERSGGLLDGERQAPRDHADGCGLGPVGEPTGRGLAGPGGSDAGALPAAPSLRWPARPGEPQHEWEEPRLVAYAERSARSDGAPERIEPGHVPAESTRGGDGSRSRASRRDQEAAIPGDAQQPLGCATARLPERLVRAANRHALRAYGNAVVPAVVEAIGRAILAAEALDTRDRGGAELSIAVPTNPTNPNPEANDARACSPVEASAVECSGSPAGPPAVNPGIGPRSTGAPVVVGHAGALFAAYCEMQR